MTSSFHQAPQRRLPLRSNARAQQRLRLVDPAYPLIKIAMG